MSKAYDRTLKAWADEKRASLGERVRFLIRAANWVGVQCSVAPLGSIGSTAAWSVQRERQTASSAGMHRRSSRAKPARAGPLVVPALKSPEEEMGQYYYVVNTSKKQYIHPHKFGDGLKLLEFGCSSCGTMTALAVLLANGNGRGGGDLESNDPIVGSWAGDSIVVAGDYADGEFVPREDADKYHEGNDPNLKAVAGALYEDISEKVLVAMREGGAID